MSPITSLRPYGAVVLACALAVGGSTAAAGQATGQVAGTAVPQDSLDVIEVTAVAFPGARSLDRDLLLDAIRTGPTRCASALFAAACALGDWDWSRDRRWLDPAEAVRDAERLELLYEAWGYPGTRVMAEWDTAARTVVRFAVREADPLLLESIDVRGLGVVNPPIELPPRLPLRPGDPYALPRLAMIEEWLLDRLAERGHPFGRVEIGGAVDEDARTARLVLELEPGPPARFGAVHIEAADPIADRTIRAMLRFGPGEPYHLERLYETERAIYMLPIVEQVVIQPAVERPPETDPTTVSGPATAPDTVIVPVRVRVAARERTATGVEATLTSTECLTLAGYRRDRHFLAGPRLLGLGAGLTHLGAGPLDGGFPCTSSGSGDHAGPHYFAEANLLQPWPGRPGTRLELGLSTSRSAAPDVYMVESHGATFGVSHDLSPALTGVLRYAPAHNTLRATAAYFCGGYGVCTADGVDALAGPRWLAPVEAILTWTPAGEPHQTLPPQTVEERALWGPLPWSYWASAGMEAAGGWSGSGWSYRRAIAEAAATRPIGLRAEVAGHVRAGWIRGSEVLPPLVRLYAGGLYSVRGFAENMLGPATLVTAASTASELGCDPVCPSDLTVGPDPVAVRPTGGGGVVEGSIEVRRWVGDRLQIAAFVDAGALHRGPLEIDGTTALAGGWTPRITPGIGVRLLGNLGPIRVDLGYDPSGPRDRPLFASSDDGDLDFRGVVRFDPFGHDDPAPMVRLFRRLQLHVGIGQPF